MTLWLIFLSFSLFSVSFLFLPIFPSKMNVSSIYTKICILKHNIYIYYYVYIIIYIIYISLILYILYIYILLYILYIYP